MHGRARSSRRRNCPATASIRRMKTSSRLVASGAAVAPVSGDRRVDAALAAAPGRGRRRGGRCRRARPARRRRMLSQPARDRRRVAAADDDGVQAGRARSPRARCRAPPPCRRRCRRCGGSARPRPCSGWRRARSARPPASSWISSQNSRRAFGSTPAVGSSRSRSCGWCMTQAASASRCFQPPDSVPASWSLRLVRPRRVERVGRRIPARGFRS